MKQLFIRFYIVLIVGFFIIVSGVMPVVNELVQEENIIFDKSLAKGTFFFLTRELSGLDENGCRALIERLQPEFGYPLSIVRLDEVTVDEKYQADLMNGFLIRDTDRNIHLIRLAGRDLVLETGPYNFERVLARIRLFFWIMMTILLILPAGLWSFFMQRNLKRIEKTTEEFIAGDHSIRLKFPRFFLLKKIAGAFNDMAESTQTLINSQKDLVNSVSHEIRTPLSRIKFSLEMLRGMNREPSGEKDYIREIYEDVEEINSLVDEMLTYARFERKRELLEVLLKTEMISWLDELVTGEQKSNRDKVIRFQVQPQAELFINRYEPVYLARAVKNLIRNAVKYTNQRINVVFEPGKDFCCIHVDDDGPGIPVEARERIFEPFSRLDQSRHRKSGGYGLGLAIAKQIVLWHKGEIWVGVSPMQGARFSIRLPVFS